MISIDILIPTYRLLSEYLIAITQMDIPSETTIRFIIISDNPDAKTGKEFQSIINDKKIIFIQNSENLGASKTRNVGINNSTADWILFLDDDIKPVKNLLSVYVQAILENPEDIGFIGDVQFPPPINLFTRALQVSNMLAAFSIGNKRKQLKWAPSANVMIKRLIIGDIRFNESFPKNGGAEENDFFLRIFKNTGKELKCLKGATVYHNWWNNGKRDYTRFIRWGMGYALLQRDFPEYTFYSFPNIVECIFLFPILFLITSIFIHLPLLSFFCILMGILLGEYFVTCIQLIRQKGFSKCKYAIEVILILSTLDIGRLIIQLKQHTLAKGFCRRIDYFCDGKNIPFQRRWAGLKFLTYIILTITLYYLIRK